MTLTLLPRNNLVIAEERQRREFLGDDLYALAESIALGTAGLLHPIVVRTIADSPDDRLLVAGERRTIVLDALHDAGIPVRCNGQIIPLDHYPIVDVGELSVFEAAEAELHENLLRKDLTWVEKAQAIAGLEQLRTGIALEQNLPPPTIKDLAAEVFNRPVEKSDGGASRAVSTSLLVARHLDIPEVAKAKSLQEAVKVVTKIKEQEHRIELAKVMGEKVAQQGHECYQGDMVEVLPKFENGTFDLILSDPIYGVGAHAFGAQGGSHEYDDSYETWQRIMPTFFSESFRITKERASLYAFCDYVRFAEMAAIAKAYGWSVYPYPIIWNKNGGVASRPEHWPKHSYETILFALKGDKPHIKLGPDVISTPFQTSEREHAAQKPVQLYVELLARAVLPGAKVCDPFCGRGTIFMAANIQKVFAVGIEKNPAMFTVAAAKAQSTDMASAGKTDA